jgi:hypothetical protein
MYTFTDTMIILIIAVLVILIQITYDFIYNRFYLLMTLLITVSKNIYVISHSLML